MKINIITHYYPPEPGAPQARISEMARKWHELGAEVSVYTGMPNHPDGVVKSSYKGKMFLRESIDDITVFRHWLYATPNKGFLKKILNHISFMITVVLLSLFRGSQPDVIVVSSPTFFSVISAYIISLIRRVPFVFEVRDLWPGIFIELGVLKNTLIIKILETIEVFLYRRAALIITVTKGFKDDIAKRGIPVDKIQVVTNGADLNKFLLKKDSEMRKILNVKDNDFLITYAGAHGISQNLITILKVAKKLSGYGNIKFAFIGDGAEKDKMIRYARENKLENVIFNPPVDKTKMVDLYCSSDVCLVPLKDIPGFKTFIPSKMFEILACGTPIIASLKGEAADILQRSESAMVVNPDDVNAISEAIVELESNRDLLKKLRKNSRNFVDMNFNREKLATHYYRLLEKLTKVKL